jgi:type II secretory pathway predicted ATPase ExeA
MQLYLEHFGLNEAPFRITPHTEFFFSGANRGATLDALLYAILHDEGIVKISGEVGSGKTMLSRVLIERLPANIRTIYLANPSLSREEILFALAEELGLELDTHTRATALLRRLQEHLIAAHEDGHQVVVLIDEAHAMPLESLEEIRLLSNLESNRHKLLQMVLFGQPELDAILARADMRQLKERITHNFGLEPLVREDIANYVDFRMRAAGYKGPPVFNRAAIQAMTRVSKGLTRRVNILADKALLAAFSAGSHAVGAREMRAAIRDSDFSAAVRNPHHRLSLRWRIPAIAALGAAVITAALVWHLKPEPSSVAVTTVAPVSAANAEAMAPSTAVSNTAPASPAQTPSGAQSISPTIAAPAKANPPATVPAQITSAPIDSPLPSGSGPLTREALLAGESWLASAGNNRWFLQLTQSDASNPDAAESFLGMARAAGLNPAELRAYRSTRRGTARYGVIYGDFATQAEAVAAIQTLPAAVRSSRPYARPIRHLR